MLAPKRLARAIALAAALGAVACGDGADSADLPPAGGTRVTPELLARGKTVYLESCADCHGAGGRGDGPGSAQLPTPPRDQTDRSYMDALTDREIAETVVYGGGIRGYPSMPALPHLSGPDLVAVVAWVRVLSRGEVEQVELTVDQTL